MKKIIIEIFKNIPFSLIAFCGLFAYAFTSCISEVVVFNGTIDDIFIDTNVKRINIPFWVEVIGSALFFVCLLCSFSSSVMVRKLRPSKTKYKLAYWVYAVINLLLFVGMVAVTSLLGFFAFAMEVLDFDWVFNFPLFLQIGLILLVCLYALLYFFSDLEKLGFKSPFVHVLSGVSNKVTKKMFNHIEIKEDEKDK